MDDIYGNKIEEQVFETSQTAPKDTLPVQFKTVLGKMVKLAGKPFNDVLALITYSTSKLQGNTFINSAIQDVASLLKDIDELYEEGFLENEAFEECDSIVLPIDGVNIADMLKGVIIDRDLRSYVNGFEWLLDSNSDALHKSNNIENVLRSVLVFLKTMNHLRNKNIIFNKIDGHHFFFNTEYGEFQFVFDGVDIAQTNNIDDSYDNTYQYAVSCIIMYLLTGTKINKQIDTMLALSILSEDDAEDGLVWDQASNNLCGSQSSLKAWNSLPEEIRNTLFDIFFADTTRSVTLDEWEMLLSEVIPEVEACAFCSHNAFKTAKQCIYCGNTTEKADLLTKWLIETNSQPQYLKIAFGRGTTLSGGILGIHLNTSEFMRLMYNPKTNSLGLKNLSNISWFITADENYKEIIPGKVVSIKDELEITFDRYPDVFMRFLGYEQNKK